MSRYRFELADEADDAQLREVLAATPMDGDIAVSFQREPSYFDAAVVGGDFVQTVVGRVAESGRVVGFGVRSVRDMYVNGKAMPIGYLSSLRLVPEHRNVGLIARGYRYFAELHQDGRTPLYLTTIAEGNDRAMSNLTGGRAGLPPYHDAGKYLTLVIPACRPGTVRSTADVSIRAATEKDLPAIVSFLNEHGPRRQFFPEYRESDFLKRRCTFRDLSPADILLATEPSRTQQAGRIVGTLALWNQSKFRQSVVQRYSRRLRWTKPFYNLVARIRRAPRLPAVGRPFRYCSAALGVVAEDDPAVFAALLASARERLSRVAIPHLLIGLHETDPLFPVAERYSVARYVTRLYLVCWEEGDALRLSLDGRPPYLELGTL